MKLTKNQTKIIFAVSIISIIILALFHRAFQIYINQKSKKNYIDKILLKEEQKFISIIEKQYLLKK